MLPVDTPTFQVTYDLNGSGKDYSLIEDRLRQAQGIRAETTTTWFVKAGSPGATAESIYGELRGYVDDDDDLLVTQVVDSYPTIDSLTPIAKALREVFPRPTIQSSLRPSFPNPLRRPSLGDQLAALEELELPPIWPPRR